MSLQRKLNVKIFLMFIVAENTGSVNIGVYTSNKSEDSNGRTENENTDKIITKSDNCGCEAPTESENGFNESYA